MVDFTENTVDHATDTVADTLAPLTSSSGIGVPGKIPDAFLFQMNTLEDAVENVAEAAGTLLDNVRDLGAELLDLDLGGAAPALVAGAGNHVRLVFETVDYAGIAVDGLFDLLV